MSARRCAVGAGALVLGLAPTVAGEPAPASELAYCNQELTWGDLPVPEDVPAGLRLSQVHVTVRHGARVAAVYKPGQCWHDDTLTFNCDNIHQLASSDARPGRPGREYVFLKEYAHGVETYKGNCMDGQLSFDGYQEHFDNGQKLRDLYVNKLRFLSPELKADEVYFRSTDVPRTVRSGQALVRGLWPLDGKGDQWTQAPVHWHVRDKGEDNMTPNPKVCPAYKDKLDEWMAAAGLRLIPHAQAAVKAWAAQHTGINVTDLDTFEWPLSDCLYEHVCPTVGAEHQGLPQAFKENHWEAFKESTRLARDTMWGQGQDRELARLAVGPILTDYLKALTPAFSSQQVAHATKFHLWSGHDAGPIGPVMAAFNFSVADEYRWPAFASELIWEVWTPDAHHMPPMPKGGDADLSTASYFRFLSNGKVTRPRVCHDRDWCPAETFLHELRDLLPADGCKKKAAAVEVIV